MILGLLSVYYSEIFECVVIMKIEFLYFCLSFFLCFNLKKYIQSFKQTESGYTHRNKLTFKLAVVHLKQPQKVRWMMLSEEGR